MTNQNMVRRPGQLNKPLLNFRSFDAQSIGQVQKVFLFLDHDTAQNLAQGINDDPKSSAGLNKLKSIEVKDGRLIVRTRGMTNEPAKEPFKAP